MVEVLVLLGALVALVPSIAGMNGVFIRRARKLERRAGWRNNLNAGTLLSSSAAGCFAPALLDRSQSLGDIVQNVFFRRMRLIRGVRRKRLPRVRGRMRDQSPHPDVD